MFWRNLAAFAAMSPLVLAAVDARAAPPAPCWQAGELPASRLHEFKTMLLVGALKCHDRAPGALEGYNQFVNQKRELLLASIYVVKAHFIRDSGMTLGASGFADYETGLGNRYSSMAHDDAFCAKVGTYARLAAKASDEDIGVLAGAVGPAPATDQCGPQAALGREPMALAAVQPVVVTEPLPIEAAAAATDIAAVTPIAATPAVTAPDPPPKAMTSSAPSAAQALADAAKALAAAAAALEGQNTAQATAPKPD